MKAIIVGGGIGGLTAAVALHQRGWQVEVLERAPEFTEVGAGLAIQPNGLRALDALGLGDGLRAGCPAGPPAGIRRTDGGWLVRNDVDDLRRRFGPWVTVHRAALVDLLRRAVPPGARSGRTCPGRATSDTPPGASSPRPGPSRGAWRRGGEAPGSGTCRCPTGASTAT